MTIRGDPARLEEYSARTLPTLSPLAAEVAGYRGQVDALLRAPTDLDPGVWARSAWIDLEIDALRRIDARPAAFGFALRQLDRFVADSPRDRTYRYTNDAELFNALVEAKLSAPDRPDDAVYRDALDRLTGSPEELAAEAGAAVRAILDSMDGDDVDALQFELIQLLATFDQYGYGYADTVPPTPEENTRRAWTVLNTRGDDGIVPAPLVDRLTTVTDLLARRRYDATFTTSFYEALGPETAAQLPRAITLASWSDHVRTSGEPGFDVDDALIAVDVSLAQASSSLDGEWRDALFAGAVDDGTADDAFPLLFRYGQYSTPFATSAGQLGLDVLHGEVTVDRGVGSPGYDDFDVLSTAWEERGTVLLDAAARTPEAANALLLEQENAGWITDDTFGRDGRHSPDWHEIDGPVRALIVAGTVELFATDPADARRAAINVIEGALEEGPGDASDALAGAYGEMTLTYLPDFSRSPGFDASPVYDPIGGAHIQIGAFQAAQFVSLAMTDETARERILRMRDVLDLQIAVDGMQGELRNPVWQQRLANVDGIVLSAANGEEFLSAEEADAAAEEFNSNVDFVQDLAMSTIGLKWELPGPLGVLTDRGLEELKDSFIYRDADNVDRAGHTTSVANWNLFDHERFVIAQAELVVAVHDDVAGRATAEQQAFIDYATATLGPEYVDALRAAAAGDPSVTRPDVEPWRLHDFAGYSSIEDFTIVSNYTDVLLPNDPRGLW